MTIIELNRAQALSESYSKHYIGRQVEEFVPYQAIFCELLNGVVPWLRLRNLTAPSEKNLPYDLEDIVNNVRVECEVGTWNKKSKHCSPNRVPFPDNGYSTLNMLARKKWSESDIFMKFVPGLQSGFLVRNSRIVALIESGVLKAQYISSPTTEGKTSNLVYPIDAKLAKELENERCLLIVKDSDYSEIESFFEDALVDR